MRTLFVAWQTDELFAGISCKQRFFNSLRHGQTMAAKTNPFTFLQQVRTEVSKVTWPTRRETVVSSIMVFVMVALAMLFFFSVDQILAWFVGLLLSFGS